MKGGEMERGEMEGGEMEGGEMAGGEMKGREVEGGLGTLAVSYSSFYVFLCSMYNLYCE